MPNSTARLLNVTISAGNEMNVAMKNCLSRRLAAVHSDIETNYTCIEPKDIISKLMNEISARQHFFFRQTKEIGDMSFWDNQ